MDNHPRLISRSLDFNLGHTGMKETLLDHLADLDILMEQLRIIFAGIPPR
jgi:hypothetical protein